MIFHKFLGSLMKILWFFINFWFFLVKSLHLFANFLGFGSSRGVRFPIGSQGVQKWPFWTPPGTPNWDPPFRPPFIGPKNPQKNPQKPPKTPQKPPNTPKKGRFREKSRFWMLRTYRKNVATFCPTCKHRGSPVPSSYWTPPKGGSPLYFDWAQWARGGPHPL